MLGPVGLPELLVIFMIVILVFGAKKLPELASGLGKGIKEFKKATKEEVDKPQVKPGDPEEPKSDD